jgi:UDP-N-acetylmuramate dehydrogenase
VHVTDACTLARDVPLGARNTLRVAATARWFASLRRPDAIGPLLDDPEFEGAPVLVLGDGSNVLFAADFPGLIVQPQFASAAAIEDDGTTVLVRVEAGHGWDAFVSWTLAHGLCGLENLSLIPGLVGAAPIQNIGAYGAEIGEFITAVEAWDRRAPGPVRLGRDECRFGYRDSVFRRDPDRWIVTAIELSLSRRFSPRLDYAGVREELAAAAITEPTAASVADAIRRVRRRKLPDPAVIGNAGSFFKNPVVPAAIARDLGASHPAMPVHAAGDRLCKKLSAAWLIEACGWRGHRHGDAGISSQHSLVLVNHGHATGAELLDLARQVARSVESRFGVQLEPEPRIVGASFRDS